MADFKISGKNVITQAGTAEPVLASNVTLGTGIITPANIQDAATSTLSCTTNSTTTVTTADTSTLSVGMAVSGTGIPAGATIVTVPNSTSFTLSAAATASATNTLTFQKGIVASKIEDDAVTSAKVADDAVTAAKIATGAVVADGLGADSVTATAIATGAVVADGLGAAAVTTTALHADVTAGGAISTAIKPHIQPGILCPAVAGKLLDGTTSHSGAYGTAQSDGKSYYYTDIKGSGPIKDPRIGAHFGSQRHKFRTVQLLEQETSMMDKECYSVDGREWIRLMNIHSGYISTGGYSNNVINFYDSSGNGIVFDQAGQFIEITGYFNAANFLMRPITSYDTFDVAINGTDLTTNNLALTSNSVLLGRHEDPSTVVPISFSTTPTLGINTLKITKNNNLIFFGIELIAQDTTSTTTKSQIQIHAQNVVSYGKKFALSAAATHYNPFAQSQTGAAVTINSSTTNTAKLTGGWSGTGATYYSSELDTATSLGLSAWVSGGEYFRPVNGGRVIWWINSSGALKCSVNMMPPAGTAVDGVTSGHNVPTGVHNWATKHQPALYSTTIDHSQAELAKSFFWREFGNGSANGNTNATYADASMLSATADAFDYTMDDGLTTLSSNGYKAHSYGLIRETTSRILWIKFIGTGISMDGYNGDGPIVRTMAQNLPYQTHNLAITSGSSGAGAGLMVLDGLTIKTFSGSGTDNNYDYGVFSEMSFLQPKMPPIPENACIVADYMLMADFVPQSGHSAPNARYHISKGLRDVVASRDHSYDTTTGSFTFTVSQTQGPPGSHVTAPVSNSNTSTKIRLPSFGTNIVARGYQLSVRGSIYIGSSLQTDTLGAHADYNDYGHITTDVTLGMHDFGVNANNAAAAMHHLSTGVATPIHTSSHYQSFETAYLHELVGGDRNMEQTNLVVTADGKTWDEVTRDTSYIGNICCRMSTDTGVVWANFVIFDEWRGTITAGTHNRPVFTKDFAIAYNGLICLKDGEYELYAQTHGTGQHQAWTKNGSYISGYAYSSSNAAITNLCYAQLSRGDFIQLRGVFGTGDLAYNDAHIKRLK